MRWEGLGCKGYEKTGTAPSYGAALMAAPPPPLAPGGERPAPSRLFVPLAPKTLRTAETVTSIPRSPGSHPLCGRKWNFCIYSGAGLEAASWAMRDLTKRATWGSS